MTLIPTSARRVSSGIAPVSVLAERNGAPSAIDIHAAGTYPIAWTSLIDNTWDFNTLTALPAGLGLSFAIDGSSPLITATENGTWFFQLSVAITSDPLGPTWAGLASFPGTPVGPTARAPATGASYPTWSGIFQLPAGAAQAIGVTTLEPSTANPYMMTGPELFITRLG